MEDKRTALAVIISILVILAYQKYLSDQKRYELAQFKAQNPVALQVNEAGVAVTEQAASTTFQPTAQGQGAPAVAQIKATAAQLPSEEELHAAPQTFVESAVSQVAINHLGARISSFQLRNYRVRVGSDELLDLVSHQSGEPLPLAFYFSTINDHRVLYTLERSAGLTSIENSANRFAIQAAESELVFVGAFPNGVRTQWPTDDPGLSRAARIDLQKLLVARGHDVSRRKRHRAAADRRGDQALRRLRRFGQRQRRYPSGRALRPDRPERLGKDHADQLHLRRVPHRGRHHRVRWR